MGMRRPVSWSPKIANQRSRGPGAQVMTFSSRSRSSEHVAHVGDLPPGTVDADAPSGPRLLVVAVDLERGRPPGDLGQHRSIGRAEDDLAGVRGHVVDREDVGLTVADEADPADPALLEEAQALGRREDLEACSSLSSGMVTPPLRQLVGLHEQEGLGMLLVVMEHVVPDLARVQEAQVAVRALVRVLFVAHHAHLLLCCRAPGPRPQGTKVARRGVTDPSPRIRLRPRGGTIGTTTGSWIIDGVIAGEAAPR